MQRNQWKTASEQILSHWRRSGITHVPTGKPESIPSATEWLELNENSVFEENDVAANKRATNDGAANDNATNDGAANSDTSTAVVVPASVQTNFISPSPLTTQSARPVGAVSDFVPGNWNTPSLDFVARQAAFQELNEQVMACRK